MVNRNLKNIINGIDMVDLDLSLCKVAYKKTINYYDRYERQLKIFRDSISDMVSKLDIADDVYDVHTDEYPDSGLMVTFDFKDDTMPHCINPYTFFELCEKGELTVENIKKYSF